MSGTGAGGWAEAWLILFCLASSLGAGALVALLLGRLLREEWLPALRPALAAAARALPVLLPLALPLLWWTGALFPWATQPDQPDGPRAWWFSPAVFGGRTALWLGLWCALGLWAARGSRGGAGPGIALLLLLPSAAMAMQDWALSRDEAPLGGLLGLGLAVGGTAAALAAAALCSPAAQPGHPTAAAPHPEGLQRTLLTLSLAVLWLGFVQFLVAWTVDLPVEAEWYARRLHGPWFWIEGGVALPSLLGAVLLTLVPQWRRWRMRGACALLVLQHLAHLAWAVRPAAAAPTAWTADALVAALALAAAAGAAWVATRAAARAATRRGARDGARDATPDGASEREHGHA